MSVDKNPELFNLKNTPPTLLDKSNEDLKKFVPKINNEDANINLLLSSEEIYDKSTDQYTDLRILRGTHIETINPSIKPCFLSSAARSGCDSVILLEIKDDFTANGVITHWSPGGTERAAHIRSISQLSDEIPKGTRFATIVSATIKSIEEAEQSELFKVVTQWNRGIKPDLIYIPINNYKVEKFSGSLYQSELYAGEIDDSSFGYEISILGTEYSKTITPLTISDVANKPTIFTKGEVK